MLETCIRVGDNGIEGDGKYVGICRPQYLNRNVQLRASTSPTDNRFSRLTVILHTGHRMNDPGVFIGIKLDLARTSD